MKRSTIAWILFEIGSIVYLIYELFDSIMNIKNSER